MWLTVKAGNGGEPLPHALRRPHLPKGPGYGGHGGSVILKSTNQIESFMDVPEMLVWTTFLHVLGQFSWLLDAYIREAALQRRLEKSRHQVINLDFVMPSGTP